MDGGAGARGRDGVELSVVGTGAAAVNAGGPADNPAADAANQVGILPAAPLQQAIRMFKDAVDDVLKVFAPLPGAPRYNDKFWGNEIRPQVPQPELSITNPIQQIQEAIGILPDAQRKEFIQAMQNIWKDEQKGAQAEVFKRFFGQKCPVSTNVFSTPSNAEIIRNLSEQLRAALNPPEVAAGVQPAQSAGVVFFNNPLFVAHENNLYERGQDLADIFIHAESRLVDANSPLNQKLQLMKILDGAETKQQIIDGLQKFIDRYRPGLNLNAQNILQNSGLVIEDEASVGDAPRGARVRDPNWNRVEEALLKRAIKDALDANKLNGTIQENLDRISHAIPDILRRAQALHLTGAALHGLWNEAIPHEDNSPLLLRLLRLEDGARAAAAPAVAAASTGAGVAPAAASVATASVPAVAVSPDREAQRAQGVQDVCNAITTKIGQVKGALTSLLSQNDSMKGAVTAILKKGHEITTGEGVRGDQVGIPVGLTSYGLYQSILSQEVPINGFTVNNEAQESPQIKQYIGCVGQPGAPAPESITWQKDLTGYLQNRDQQLDAILALKGALTPAALPADPAAAGPSADPLDRVIDQLKNLYKFPRETEPVANLGRLKQDIKMIQGLTEANKAAIDGAHDFNTLQQRLHAIQQGKAEALQAEAARQAEATERKKATRVLKIEEAREINDTTIPELQEALRRVQGGIVKQEKKVAFHKEKYEAIPDEFKRGSAPHILAACYEFDWRSAEQTLCDLQHQEKTIELQIAQARRDAAQHEQTAAQLTLELTPQAAAARGGAEAILRAKTEALRLLLPGVTTAEEALRGTTAELKAKRGEVVRLQQTMDGQQGGLAQRREAFQSEIRKLNESIETKTEKERALTPQIGNLRRQLGASFGSARETTWETFVQNQTKLAQDLQTKSKDLRIVELQLRRLDVEERKAKLNNDTLGIEEKILRDREQGFEGRAGNTAVDQVSDYVLQLQQQKCIRDEIQSNLTAMDAQIAAITADSFNGEVEWVTLYYQAQGINDRIETNAEQSQALQPQIDRLNDQIAECQRQLQEAQQRQENHLLIGDPAAFNVFKPKVNDALAESRELLSQRMAATRELAFLMDEGTVLSLQKELAELKLGLANLTIRRHDLQVAIQLEKLDLTLLQNELGRLKALHGLAINALAKATTELTAAEDVLPQDIAEIERLRSVVQAAKKNVDDRDTACKEKHVEITKKERDIESLINEASQRIETEINGISRAIAAKKGESNRKKTAIDAEKEGYRSGAKEQAALNSFSGKVRSPQGNGNVSFEEWKLRANYIGNEQSLNYLAHQDYLSLYDAIQCRLELAHQVAVASGAAAAAVSSDEIYRQMFAYFNSQNFRAQHFPEAERAAGASSAALPAPMAWDKVFDSGFDDLEDKAKCERIRDFLLARKEAKLLTQAIRTQLNALYCTQNIDEQTEIRDHLHQMLLFAQNECALRGYDKGSKFVRMLVEDITQNPQAYHLNRDDVIGVQTFDDWVGCVSHAIGQHNMAAILETAKRDQQDDSSESFVQFVHYIYSELNAHHRGFADANVINTQRIEYLQTLPLFEGYSFEMPPETDEHNQNWLDGQLAIAFPHVLLGEVFKSIGTVTPAVRERGYAGIIEAFSWFQRNAESKAADSYERDYPKPDASAASAEEIAQWQRGRELFVFNEVKRQCLEVFPAYLEAQVNQMVQEPRIQRLVHARDDLKNQLENLHVTTEGEIESGFLEANRGQATDLLQKYRATDAQLRPFGLIQEAFNQFKEQRLPFLRRDEFDTPESLRTAFAGTFDDLMQDMERKHFEGAKMASGATSAPDAASALGMGIRDSSSKRPWQIDRDHYVSRLVPPKFYRSYQPGLYEDWKNMKGATAKARLGNEHTRRLVRMNWDEQFTLHQIHGQKTQSGNEGKFFAELANLAQAEEIRLLKATLDDVETKSTKNGQAQSIQEAFDAIHQTGRLTERMEKWGATAASQKFEDGEKPTQHMERALLEHTGEIQTALDALDQQYEQLMHRLYRYREEVIRAKFQDKQGQTQPFSTKDLASLSAVEKYFDQMAEAFQKHYEREASRIRWASHLLARPGKPLFLQDQKPALRIESEIKDEGQPNQRMVFKVCTLNPDGTSANLREVSSLRDLWGMIQEGDSPTLKGCKQQARTKAEERIQHRYARLQRPCESAVAEGRDIDDVIHSFFADKRDKFEQKWRDIAAQDSGDIRRFQAIQEVEGKFGEESSDEHSPIKTFTLASEWAFGGKLKKPVEGFLPGYVDTWETQFTTSYYSAPASGYAASVNLLAKRKEKGGDTSVAFSAYTGKEADEHLTKDQTYLQLVRNQVRRLLLSAPEGVLEIYGATPKVREAALRIAFEEGLPPERVSMPSIDMKNKSVKKLYEEAQTRRTEEAEQKRTEVTQRNPELTGDTYQEGAKEGPEGEKSQEESSDLLNRVRGFFGRGGSPSAS